MIACIYYNRKAVIVQVDRVNKDVDNGSAFVYIVRRHITYIIKKSVNLRLGQANLWWKYIYMPALVVQVEQEAKAVLVAVAGVITTVEVAMVKVEMEVKAVLADKEETEYSDVSQEFKYMAEN